MRTDGRRNNELRSVSFDRDFTDAAAGSGDNRAEPTLTKPAGPPAAKPASEPMAKPADTSLKLPEPESEEDLLEIPAFLRRQAN